MTTASDLDPRYDAIVIGSGLGGSSAAAHLAAGGKKVLLLERYSVLGGSSHVFRRQGKWEFDCGIHYIGNCGPDGDIPTMFRGLGVDDRIEWLPLDQQGFDTVVAPGFELKIPQGWERYEQNLLEAFPSERRAVRRFVAIMRKIADGTDRCLTPSSTKEYTKAVKRFGWATPFANMPLAAILGACGFSPRAVLVLSVQAGALGSTPLSIAGSMHAGFLLTMVAGGAYYPRGGGQMLTAAFAEVTRSHGGEIRTNTGVQKILVEGGKVTGVLLEDGSSVTAPVVVAAGDILKTYNDLVGLEHLPRLQRERVKHWKMATPVVNCFVGVEDDLASTPNSNYFVIPTWEDATSLPALIRMLRGAGLGHGFDDGTAWAQSFASRMPMFVQSSSRRDLSYRRAAPEGHGTIEIQTITPSSPRLWGLTPDEVESGDYRKNARYLEIKKVVTDGMLDRMETAYPGSSSKVKLLELGTPATQERFVGNTGGAAMGLDPRPSQAGPFRPGVRTAIDGLFLAGTSTAWGPGTEGSMLSGQYAAAAILGRDLAGEARAGQVLADRSRLTTWGADFDPLSVSRGRGVGSADLDETLEDLA